MSRNTIIALLVLVILGSLALFVSRTPEPEQTHKLFDIKPADIQTIQLKSPGRDILIRRASDKSWQMVRPVPGRAEINTADAMAGAIADLEIVGTADPNPTDLAPFGLEQPAVMVTVTTDKGKLPQIAVGKDAPVGGNSYIMTSDGPAVLLVSSSFPGEVVKNADDLRSHELFTLKSADINRIVITNSDGTTNAFERQKDGNWLITKPQKYPADAAQMTQLLSALTNARAIDFIEDNPDSVALGKYGLTHPSETVALYGGPGNVEESLLFGFKRPEASRTETYARRAEGDQPVCTVGDYLIKATNHSFDDFRDKTVLPFDQSNAGRIEIAGGPIDITLTRGAGDKWTVSSNGKSVPADPAVTDSLISQIHDLKGTSVAAPSLTDPLKFGMTKPNLIVTVDDQHGKEIGTVKLSQMELSTNPQLAAQGHNTLKRFFGYAVSSTNPAVYEIEPQAVTDLENTASRLSAETQPTPAPSPSPAASAAPAMPSPAGRIASPAAAST
jgi:hypothetical protein